MEPNHYTIILPGLTEWAERYRLAYDAESGSVKADGSRMKFIYNGDVVRSVSDVG